MTSFWTGIGFDQVERKMDRCLIVLRYSLLALYCKKYERCLSRNSSVP